MVRNILELLEILSILYAFAAIYRKKLEYNIQEVVFIVAEIVLMIGINDYGYPRYLASLSYILMIIYCILKYHSTVKEAIINVCITIISLGLLQLILGFALTTLFRNSNSNSLLWELLVMIVCFFCIYFGSGKIPFYKVTQFLMKRNKLLFLVGVFALIVFGRQIWLMQQRGYLLGKDYIPIIYFIFSFLMMKIRSNISNYSSKKVKVTARAIGFILAPISNKLVYILISIIILIFCIKANNLKNSDTKFGINKICHNC